MTENVSTGGLKKFSYSKEEPKLNDSEKEEIRNAYARAEERKRKEKLRKTIIWIIIGLVIIAGITYFLIK